MEGEAYKPWCIQETKKHGGGSVMVWGGICTEGRTSLTRISIRLNGEQYVNLLKEYLLPSARQLFSNSYIFMQDNAPCHTAAVTKCFLSSEGITALDWPPQSPGLTRLSTYGTGLRKSSEANAIITGTKKFCGLQSKTFGSALVRTLLGTL